LECTFAYPNSIEKIIACKAMKKAVEISKIGAFSSVRLSVNRHNLTENELVILRKIG